jgi:hypothetical protein
VRRGHSIAIVAAARKLLGAQAVGVRAALAFDD